MNTNPRHFTKEEADEAYAIGKKRNARHVADGGEHRHNLKRSSGDASQDGMAAMAEAAAAAYIGVTWDKNYTKRDDGPDIGGVIGVRWTPLPYGCLLLHDSDRSDIPQVLVIGTDYPLRVVGWAWPDEVRFPKFWRDRGVRNPAYFVPQNALRSMPELITWVSKL